MAERRTTDTALNATPENRRRSTQRERILAGMVAASNRGGYAAANVSAVIGHAGVSRPTFYEYFEDRDDCFRACIEDVNQEIAAAVASALGGSPGEQAAAAVVEAVLAFAAAEPAKARFLTGEAMGGGAGALEVRDRGIAHLAGEIERAQAGAALRSEVPDLDARVLLGSVYRMLATRLRRGETAISRLAPEVLGWLASYARPARARRWESLAPGVLAAPSPHVPSEPLQRMPQLLGPGRPRIPEADIAENHRLRILYAAALLADEKGYTATTVGDIAKLARVGGRVFYRIFADKQEAFAAVHELGFQQVMDVTTKAYFSVDGWPLRSWEAGRALTQLLERNPLVAHVGFVEAYAVGPGGVQRIEDAHTAFMVFLQEGLLYAAAGAAPTRVAMEAIIDAVFEIIYLQARAPGDPQIAAMLPQIAHVWLTPFLGSEEADAFIDAQLADAQPRRRSRGA